MNFVDEYLAKHNFAPAIEAVPDAELALCIVVPCYKEPDLIRSLCALRDCKRPNKAVEVIVVINSPENCPTEALRQNQQTIDEANVWIAANNCPGLKFHLIHRPGLAAKHAGVGWARKIGMDEAAHRLMLVGNPKAVIAGFDADSSCSENYLVELEAHFRNHPKVSGAGIYFEHPTSGTEYPPELYKGIILYELHLRYLNLALRYTGHPFAWHTVGSSFAVRMEAYVKQGGMNRRQAGEDFYFLQKIIEAGGFSELNTTTVIPSPRVSDRVPFGTGASMTKWQSEHQLPTYNFEAYEVLRAFFALIDSFYKLNTTELEAQTAQLAPILLSFLNDNRFADELQIINGNCASAASFRNRFFRWFNAFRTIRFLNTAHESFYAKQDIGTEAQKLLLKTGYNLPDPSPIDLLSLYRKIEKSPIFTSLEQFA